MPVQQTWKLISLTVVLCWTGLAACSAPEASTAATERSLPPQSPAAAAGVADASTAATTSVGSPEQTIRDYYALLNIGQWEAAYSLLARARRGDRGQFVRTSAAAWESANVVALLPMAQWFAQNTVTAPSPAQLGTPAQPRYAVSVDMQWKPDWISVEPAGVHLQFITLTQEDGAWKIWEIGSAP